MPTGTPHNFVHDSISFVLACIPAVTLLAVFVGNLLEQRRRVAVPERTPHTYRSARASLHG